MDKRLRITFCFLFTFILMSRLYAGVEAEIGPFHVHVNPNGTVQKRGNGGISWNSNPLIFDHDLWVLGYQNGKLAGSTPMWDSDCSPGPVIDGKAALIHAPEDSLKYRSYILTPLSQSGQPDYDEWPADWGASVHPNGSPRRIGDVIFIRFIMTRIRAVPVGLKSKPEKSRTRTLKSMKPFGDMKQRIPILKLCTSNGKFLIKGLRTLTAA